MTEPNETVLTEQRDALREQLLAKRDVIAHQLGSTPASADTYPRSFTMRLLIRKPALTFKVASKIFSLIKRRSPS